MCVARVGSVCLLAAVAAVAGDRRTPPPIDAGMVERTGVSLLLLDVRATDERGQPMRGLEQDDFKVFLDGDVRQLESVDDLCSCVGEPVAEAPAAARAETTDGPAPAPIDAMRFVLHLDFSQLDLDGRLHAVEQAERWARETMRSEDQAMLTAYASGSGLVVLVGFSSDRERLAAAAREAYGSTAFRDPFPAAYDFRVRDCGQCCKHRDCNCRACWWRAASEEHRHSRGSLRALAQLLERLQAEPGRKALLLFNQRGTLFPARYYPTDERRIGDHLDLVDRVAAEATLARAAIYPAFTGETDNPLATNFGANLADMTGGRHGGRLSELSALLDGAGRGCECIYRLGLAPPDREGHVYRVRVETNGRRLEASHRITYLGTAERWMRSARAVLSDPERARDLPLAAAIVPVGVSKKGWDLRVQVALDPTALEMLPTGGATTGDWEIGALVTDAGARHAWEMLGVSRLRRSAGDGSGEFAILHERTLERVPPGRYELRAFVRDRWANLYGGDLARIELPSAARPGLGGPVVLRANRRYVPTSLPLRGRAAESPGPATVVVTHGTLPLARRSVVPGELLEFLSWICRDESEGATPDVESYVAIDGRPLFRFDPPADSAAGACVFLRDRLDTSPLSPGRYTYHVRWRRAAGAEAERAEAPFAIE